MFTFEQAVGLQTKVAEFYEAGKLTCALCHGVAILRYARLSSGDPIVKGKTVTGFANVEEDFADNAVWSMNLLSRDLITGQQNFSGTETAELVVRALGE